MVVPAPCETALSCFHWNYFDPILYTYYPTLHHVGLRSHSVKQQFVYRISDYRITFNSVGCFLLYGFLGSKQKTEIIYVNKI